MTVATAPEITPAGPGADDDDIDHVYCCDPDRSLCGLDISDYDDVGDADCDDLCPWCEAIERLGVPCGSAACPDRRSP